MYILDKTETDDTPRILLFLCTNYNFRARESTPILRITGNDSVVSQACTPNAPTRGVGVWPLRTVNFNRKRGFTSRRSRYSPSLHLSASWNFRSIAELWFVPQTSSYYPLQFLAEQNSPYVIIRREIIPCRKFSTACVFFYSSSLLWNIV